MKPLKEYDVYAIPLDSIYIEDGFNCRDAFPPASVRSLAKSIGESGLQNPIFVIERGDRYQLVAGHRRFLAVKWHVGWDDIPCRVLSGLDAQTLQVINFVENLERKDLNIVEEADTLPKLWPNGYPPVQDMRWASIFLFAHICPYPSEFLTPVHGQQSPDLSTFSQNRSSNVLDIKVFTFMNTNLFINITGTDIS